MTAAVAGSGVVIARTDKACPSLAEAGERWRKAEIHADTPTERQRLADALIRCRTLMGANAPDVERALGRSDNYVTLIPVYRAVGLVNYSWVLGPQRSGMQVDYEHLLLRTDSQQKVVYVGIVTD